MSCLIEEYLFLPDNILLGEFSHKKSDYPENVVSLLFHSVCRLIESYIIQMSCARNLMRITKIIKRLK